MIKKFVLWLCYCVIGLSIIFFALIGFVALLTDFHIIHYLTNVINLMFNEENARFSIAALIAFVPSSILAYAAVLTSQGNKITAEANRNKNRLEKAKNLRAALREFRDKDRDFLLELSKYTNVFEQYENLIKRKKDRACSNMIVTIPDSSPIQRLTEEDRDIDQQLEKIKIELSSIQATFPILRKESQLVESALLSEVNGQNLIDKIKKHFSIYVNELRPNLYDFQKSEAWALSSADIEDDFLKIIRELEQDL